MQNGCPAACVQIRRGVSNGLGCQDFKANETVAYAMGAQELFQQRGYESESLRRLAERMELQGCSAVANGDVAGAHSAKGL